MDRIVENLDAVKKAQITPQPLREAGIVRRHLGWLTRVYHSEQGCQVVHERIVPQWLFCVLGLRRAEISPSAALYPQHDRV